MTYTLSLNYLFRKGHSESTGLTWSTTPRAGCVPCSGSYEMSLNASLHSSSDLFTKLSPKNTHSHLDAELMSIELMSRLYESSPIKKKLVRP